MPNFDPVFPYDSRWLMNIFKGINDYKNALALGKFKKSARLVKGTETFDWMRKNMDRGLNTYNLAGSGAKPTVSAIKKLALLEYLDHLSKIGGESLNSPLLDLFGPVQSNRAMRSMRSKYLQEGGDSGI